MLWVDSANRLATLTDSAKRAMLLQFFRFLARVELSDVIFGPGDDRAPTPEGDAVRPDENPAK
jgi:hypothetical protein